MMGTPGKGDKSAIQSKLLFKFYTDHADGLISTRNSEQKEQTNREKYENMSHSVSQIHINPK